MATFYLINTTKVGTRVLYAGQLIDDAQEDKSAIEAQGGQLVTSANATVASAAVIAQQLRTRHQPREVLDQIMAVAYSAYLAATSGTISESELADGSVTAGKLGASAVTTAKILDGAVTAAKFEGGAGVAALLAAGLGASAAYTKVTNGVQTLLAADAAARVVLIMAIVTEAFADAGGTQTTFTIGEADTATKFAAAAVFTGLTLGAIRFFAGTLTATKALIVTANDAAGAGTGGISCTALVLPAAA